MNMYEEWTVRVDFTGISDYVEGETFNSKKKALKWAEKKVAKLEKRRYKIKEVTIQMEMKLEM